MIQRIENYLAGELSPLERTVLRYGSAWFFLILLSYYILRPIREQVGTSYGVSALSWMFWGTFGVMLIAIPLYSILVGRFHRRWLVPTIYGMFVASLLAFWLAMTMLPDEAQPRVASAFFIWVSVFGLFVVSFFWSVAGDLLNTEQGQRIFGLIMGSGTIGGMLGSQIAGRMVGWIGVAHLLLIPAVLLVVALVIYAALERACRSLVQNVGQRSGKATGGNPFAGFTAVFRSSYLLAIGGFSLMMALCSTSVYFQQSEIVDRAYRDLSIPESQVEDAAIALAQQRSTAPDVVGVSESDRTLARADLRLAASRQAKTAYFADVNFAVSAVTVVFQFVMAGFLMKRLGLGVTLAILPLIYVVGVSALALSPTISVLAVVSTLGRSAEYGLCNPAREVLYTAVNREDRYKAKSFLDTVVRRGGDSGAGSTYRYLREGLEIPMNLLSWAVIPFALAWAGIAVYLGRENRRRLVK